MLDGLNKAFSGIYSPKIDGEEGGQPLSSTGGNNS